MQQVLVKPMHIKVKEKKIVVEFSERESAFIMQKAGSIQPEDVSNYIKEKLIKVFSLDELEMTVQNVGKDFNLNKIKKVTAELKKRSRKNDKTELAGQDAAKDLKTDLIGESDILAGSASKDMDEKAMEDFSQMTEEVDDELLAELLDKNLLKRKQKPKKGAES